MQKFLLLFLFLPCLSFCQQPTIIKSNNYVNTDSTWQFIDYSSKEGWSNDSINKLKRFIIDSTNATGMVVINPAKFFLIMETSKKQVI